MFVLVNWSPSTEFVLIRGLRHGDPMTPFLFLLVVEGLIGLFRKVIKKNLYCGVRVGEKKTKVGLLQFAYDTTFLSDANKNVWVKNCVKKF